MVKYMFQMPTDADFEMLYGKFHTVNPLEHPLLGTTLDNAIVIVDDQNLNFTNRFNYYCIGEIVEYFPGDASQSDLETNDRMAYDFLNILRKCHPLI